MINRSYKNIYWASSTYFAVKSHGELINLIMKVNEGNEDTLVSDVFYVKTIYKSRTLLFAQNQKDAWSFFLHEIRFDF